MAKPRCNFPGCQKKADPEHGGTAYKAGPVVLFSCGKHNTWFKIGGTAIAASLIAGFDVVSEKIPEIGRAVRVAKAAAQAATAPEDGVVDAEHEPHEAAE